MEEIWKDVPEYEGLYQVNQFGDVFSFHTNKKLKWSLSSDGYKRYIFYKNGKKKCVLAHKLVALAFIPNPENLPLVNHKDENKLNNKAENLEWCTYSYNNTYGEHMSKKSRTLHSLSRKECWLVNLESKELKHFDSLHEAADFL